MAKNSDITSKRLIAIAPEGWVRWATNIQDASNCEILSGEFQFFSRETDMLIHIHESSVGEFLTLFEIQTRYSAEMPKRIRSYSAFAEAKYNLPVYPILINILPYMEFLPGSKQFAQTNDAPRIVQDRIVRARPYRVTRPRSRSRSGYRL